MNRIKTITVVLLLITFGSHISAQTIEIEKQYIDSILKLSINDGIKLDEIGKRWKSFRAEYNYPILPVDTTSRELLFSEIIDLDSINKKTIFSRCEQWFVLTYFQVLYSNEEAGKIIGSASTNIAHKYEIKSNGAKSLFSKTTKTNYALTLTIKDNKLKYELSDINYIVPGVDVENNYPVATLFPVISKSSTEWYNNLAYLRQLDFTLMSEQKQSLIDYIKNYKQDFEF